MNFIPNEIILLIFENIILITDKRQFLKTCNLYNNITKKSMLQYENNYKINNFKKINKYCVEKFTLELCHDKYFKMIPNSYMIPENKILIEALVTYNNIELLHKIKGICRKLDKINHYAALNGHLNILIWSNRLKFHSARDICISASTNGHLHILRWMMSLDMHCINDSTVFEPAASNGHINILKWGFANKYVFGDTIWIMAAKTGNVEILEWMTTSGLFWNPYVCRYAALNGHVNVLKWALGRGFGLDPFSYKYLESYDQMDSLK